ncbi:MAG: glycerol-3-phosphate acyltransferase [Candidatus Cryosericum sp.]|nr:glycerol-3-phosphate acyltransferase [bacterium]
MTFIAIAVGAYLLGSIPFGFLVGRWRGVDVLEIGSKSASSTNVSRALGWKWGAVSALLDFSKGFLPAYLGVRFLSSHWQIVVVALLPMVGQVYPIFLRFKGGKGASTFYGAALALIGPLYFVCFAPILLLIFAVTRKTSLANLLFSWILVVLMYIFLPLYCAIFAVGGASFLTFALRGNIQRLLKGAEPDTPLKW